MGADPMRDAVLVAHTNMHNIIILIDRMVGKLVRILMSHRYPQHLSGKVLVHGRARAQDPYHQRTDVLHMRPVKKIPCEPGRCILRLYHL